MPYTKDFSVSSIKKGSKVRRLINEDEYEYYVVGNFYPKFGFELRPSGRNTYAIDGILLYLRPDSIPSSSFEMQMPE